MSWSSFDEGAFVAELERILDAASGASDALLALVRAGPTRPERISGGFWEPEAEPASEAAEMAKVALGQANVLLRGLDKEDDEDSPAPLRAKLGPFFADGRHAVESGQPPPELVQRIYGRVFHRVLLLGRSYMEAYPDPASGGSGRFLLWISCWIRS